MDENGYGGAYTGAQIDSAIAKMLNLAAGDGITIQDGNISVTTPVKCMTVAEYNALSEEQKQSETVYIITDDNGSDGTT